MDNINNIECEQYGDRYYTSCKTFTHKRQRSNRFIHRYISAARNELVLKNLLRERNLKKDFIDKATRRYVVQSLIRQFENRSMMTPPISSNGSIPEYTDVALERSLESTKVSLLQLEITNQLKRRFAQTRDPPPTNINKVYFANELARLCH